MNKVSFIAIAIVCFFAITTAHVLSTICTVLIMTSNATAFLNYWVMFGMAIILQLTASFFLSIAITDKKLPILIRSILLILSVYLFFASVVANVGLIQNDSNKKQNIAVRESVEYKQALQTNTNQQNKLDSKLAEKKSETTTYDSAIEKIENSLNDSKTDWERNKYTTMLDNKTTEKTNTLARIERELNGITVSPINTKTISIASENGYSATFLFLAETRAVKWLFKGVSKDLLEYYFYVSQSTVFELINLLSVYLFCMFLRKYWHLVKKKPITNNFTPDPSPKQKIPTPTPSEIKPKLNLVKSKQALSLEGYKASKQNKNKDISDADIKKYLDYIYKYQAENKTNIVQGFQKISKQIGMKENRVREIVAWLKQEGVLELKNGRFTIVKNNMKGVG